MIAEGEEKGTLGEEEKPDERELERERLAERERKSNNLGERYAGLERVAG